GTAEAAPASTQVSAAEGAAQPAWEDLVIGLEQALLRGDAAGARTLLPAFVDSFRREPLLFRPLADGGHPRHVLRAHVAQAVLRALLSHLPHLGLLRETAHLLRIARAMELNAGPDTGGAGRRVTVFDQLFQLALQAVVETVVDSAASWGPAAADGK